VSRLIVLRHGQTEWNTAGRFQGVTDIDLHAAGRAQAAQAAAVLVGLQPRLVVSSDLRRALGTAQAIADLAGLQVRVDKRLRERAYGPWEGLTREEVEAQYAESFAAWRQRRPFTLDGIEPQAEVADRGAAVLTDVAAELGDDDTAIVVGHGGSARHAVAALLGWDLAQAETIRGLGNCCWADLRSGPSGWRMHGYNLSAVPSG
jgi:broad specificity phosphatase PhoE